MGGGEGIPPGPQSKSMALPKDPMWPRVLRPLDAAEGENLNVLKHDLRFVVGHARRWYKTYLGYGLVVGLMGAYMIELPPFYSWKSSSK